MVMYWCVVCISDRAGVIVTRGDFVVWVCGVQVKAFLMTSAWLNITFVPYKAYGCADRWLKHSRFVLLGNFMENK